MPTLLLLALAAVVALLLIDDRHAFNHWNPCERKDSGVKGSDSGPASGVGAGYAWDSRKVDAGRMVITASNEPNQVTMKLDFLKPFKARNTAEFTLRAQGDKLVVVSWAMQGPSPYLSKLMGVVFSIDRMVGKDFESGLANLKALTEGR